MLELFLTTKIGIEPNFLNLVEKLTGRNVGKILDRRNMAFGSLGSMVSVLGELKTEDSDAVAVQRNPGSVLRHLSIAFMLIVLEDKLVDILSESCLNFLIVDNVVGKPYATAYVSGTIEQWRTDVINGCSPQASYTFRIFTTKVLHCLEVADLGHLFDMFSKSQSKDGTLLLTHK